MFSLVSFFPFATCKLVWVSEIIFSSIYFLISVLYFISFLQPFGFPCMCQGVLQLWFHYWHAVGSFLIIHIEWMDNSWFSWKNDSWRKRGSICSFSDFPFTGSLFLPHKVGEVLPVNRALSLIPLYCLWSASMCWEHRTHYYIRNHKFTHEVNPLALEWIPSNTLLLLFFPRSITGLTPWPSLLSFSTWYNPANMLLLFCAFPLLHRLFWTWQFCLSSGG